MEDLLYVKEFYKPVFNEAKPEDMNDDQWKVLNRQACGFIRQWVDDNVLNHISNVINAKTFVAKS